MKSSLFSAVQFLIVVAVLAAGGFLMALPYAPAVKFKLASFFSERTDLFLPLGAIITFMGLILLIGFYWMNRKRYFQVSMKMPAHRIEAEEELVLKILMSYWKQMFPEEELMTDVFIHTDQKIELIAEIPKLNEANQKKALHKIEEDVGSLLAKQLGYKREFLLTVILK